MPAGNGWNDIARRVAGSVIAASIIGAWIFSATRASTAQVEAVAAQSSKQDIKHDREIELLKMRIPAEREAQIAFRADVRARLGIKK